MTLLRGVIIFVLGGLLAAALFEQQEGKAILAKGVAALDAMREAEQTEEKREAARQAKEQALTEQREALLKVSREATAQYQAAAQALEESAKLSDAGPFEDLQKAHDVALAEVEQAQAALAAHTQKVLRMQKQRRIEREAQGLRKRLDALESPDRGRAWYASQTKTISEQLRVCEALTDKERARIATRENRPPQGLAQEAPADLAPRFTKGPLTGAINIAIETNGLDAHIDDVECGEYPCIVFGRAGSSEAVRRLGELLSLDYAGAAVHRLVQTAAARSDAELEFAFVIRPYRKSRESDDVLVAADRRVEFEALGARLQYRIQRYRQLRLVP